ncbi:MAG TPA: hypothetical protein VFO49_14685 [Nocardioides sp.]|nr:hypothetical protein [Nocardioides sp.]
MRRGWFAATVLLALVLTGCSDDSDEPEEDPLEGDAKSLVSCLKDADIDATVNESVAFGVEAEHTGVEASELPSELLAFDSGQGTEQGVKLWIFGSEGDAEESYTTITLQSEDDNDERSWVDGRVVVSWYYPVNREAAQAGAVDDCVAELN